MSTDALRPDALTLPRRHERSFLRELERPSHAFRNIGPNWFASVMGTGIVATAGATLPIHLWGLRGFAEVVWVIASLLLLMLLAMVGVHWLRHPTVARSHAQLIAGGLAILLESHIPQNAVILSTIAPSSPVGRCR